MPRAGSRFTPFRRATAAICAVVAVLALAACASTAVPRDQNDVCAIFRMHPSWRRDAERAAERWGAPISAMMAIIWRESSFRHDARPPRRRVLFDMVPWGRISSAYGYSQALDGTWDWYLEDTGRSGLLTRRDDFGDAIDFVGWYMTKTRDANGVAFGDVMSHYLNYHEGHGGYRRRSYDSKPWLLRVARQVQQQADRYREQIRRCGGDF